MAKQQKVCKQDAPAQRDMPEAYYPLYSMLHTLRELQAHEDQICTLLTQLQRSGKVTSALRRELESMLVSLPATSFAQEVRALSNALDEAA